MKHESSYNNSMKAMSFLDMVTYLTVIAKTDKEFDCKLAKMIHFYHSPPTSLQLYFSNIKPFDDSSGDYYDPDENTIHFQGEDFKIIWNGQIFMYKAPKNINELISIVINSPNEFFLEFRNDLLKGLGVYEELLKVA